MKFLSRDSSINSSFVTEEMAHLANEIIFKECEKVTTQLHHFESVKEMIFGEDSAILRVPNDVRKRAQKIVEEAVGSRIWFKVNSTLGTWLIPVIGEDSRA